MFDYISFAVIIIITQYLENKKSSFFLIMHIWCILKSISEIATDMNY